jgi:CrcB protein
MNNLLAIAAAGAIGAVLRYLVASGVYEIFGRGFPYGTLIVNLIGSFLIGYLFVWFLDRSVASEVWRLAVLVGLLGSFTTFSSFSLETYNLVITGYYGRAVANIIFSVSLCLLGTWIGISLARNV